jgi:hypothetical protein
MSLPKRGPCPSRTRTPIGRLLRHPDCRQSRPGGHGARAPARTAQADRVKRLGPRTSPNLKVKRCNCFVAVAGINIAEPGPASASGPPYTGIRGHTESGCDTVATEGPQTASRSSVRRKTGSGPGARAVTVKGLSLTSAFPMSVRTDSSSGVE